MYVCVYVCMYARTCLCMHVCMDTCISTCISTSYICVHSCMQTQMYRHIHTRVHRCGFWRRRRRTLMQCARPCKIWRTTGARLPASTVECWAHALSAWHHGRSRRAASLQGVEDCGSPWAGFLALGLVLQPSSTCVSEPRNKAATDGCLAWVPPVR